MLCSLGFLPPITIIIVLYTITNLALVIFSLFFSVICSYDNDAKFVSDKARIEAPQDSFKTLLLDIYAFNFFILSHVLQPYAG